MRAKMFVVVLLCAVLLLSGSACGGGAPAVGMAAEEIRDEAIAADTELDTCQSEMDMTMDIWMTMEGETFQIATVMEAEGAIDKPNEEMYMDMTIITEMTGEEDVEMSMAVYIVEDWVYMGEEMPGEPAMWQKTPVLEGMWEEVWEQYDIVAQHLDILLGVEVELVGTETLDGTECYVLELTPDLEQLRALMIFAGAVSYPEEQITDFSVRYWIAKDTYFTLKSTVELTMVFTPESFGIPSWLAGDFEATADMAMTSSMHHINEPVSIELPPEAEEAEEMPLAEETAYNGAKEQVELGVTDYIARTFGYLPITGETITLAYPAGTFDIIDICALLVSEGGVLKWVPDSCADTTHDNCDAGPCSCNPDSHYIWLLSEVTGDVYSTCVGTECDANNVDGFQGIYP